MKERAIAIMHTTPTFQRKAMIVVVALLLLSLLSYGYFLQKAIGFTVDREHLLQSIQRANADIADLDAANVSLQKNISIERALALGYHEVANPSYITLSSGQPALGIRTKGGI